MATAVQIEGFESGFLSQGSAGDVQSTVKRTGTYALKITPVTTGTKAVSLWGFASSGAPVFNGTSIANAYVRFYIYIGTAPSADENLMNLRGVSNGIKLGLRITSSRTLKLYDADFTNLLQTSSALSLSTWYRIELRTSTSASASAYDFKIDGASVGSGTAQQKNENYAYIQFGKHSNTNGSGYDVYFDDVRVDSDGFPGEGQIKRMAPDGVGTDTGWTSSVGGAAVLADVSNVPFADAGRYCSTTTNSSTQTFTLQSASAAGIAGTIGAVKTMAFCRDIGGTSSLKVRIRSGANTDDTGGADTGGYDIYGKVYAVEPGSNAAWTTTLLNSVEVGVRSEATEQTRCQGIALEVDYSPLASNPPAAPSGLTATLNTGTTVDLTWIDNSGSNDDAEDSFELQYDIFSDFPAPTTVTDIAANATSRQVTGLEPTTTYYFRIRAINGAGNSAWSATDNEATSTTSVSSHTQDEIVCTFNTSYVRGRYIDGGGYWFVADGSGNFTLNSVAEDVGTSNVSVGGVMVDPATTSQGFDSRSPNYSAGLNQALPLTVNVSGGAKTIWVCLTLDTPENSGGNSKLWSIVQLTIVPSAPALNAIKPTGYYVAGGKRLVTTSNININAITAIPVPVGTTEPTWSDLKYHARPLVRFGGTVNSAQIAPTKFQASYPATQNKYTGWLLLGAISNVTRREHLIHRIVRCYLDIAALAALGDSTFITLGGFGGGGKGLWFFGGLFLGDTLTLPSNVTYSGKSVYFFHEDGATFIGDADGTYLSGKPLYGRDHLVGDALYSNHDMRDLDGVREPHWTTEASLTGTAQNTSSTSITLKAGQAGVSVGDRVYATSNGETKDIIAYDSGTKVATVSAWSVTPASNTTYEVYNGGAYQEIGSYELTAFAVAVILSGKVSELRSLGGTPDAMFSYLHRWIVDDNGILNPRYPSGAGISQNARLYDDAAGVWTKKFYETITNWPNAVAASIATIFLSAGGNLFRFAYPATPTLIPGVTTNASESSTGTGETAIARFDVVPYQVYPSTFRIGVVAFHINGINRVSFQANGGAIVQTTAMTLNPVTGVNEYCVDLATAASDGVVTVQAVIYPNNGVSRVLTLQLYSNGNGTAKANSVYVATDGNDTTGNGTNGNPYATVMKACKALETANGTGNADGGTVYLKAGSHVLGTYSFGNLTTTQDYWLTIRPAPGLTKADVTITGTATSDGLRTKLVHLYDLKITNGINTTNDRGETLWLDHCLLDRGDRNTRTGEWTGGFGGGQYATDCTYRNSQSGAANCLIARNCIIDYIGEIAFRPSGLVVNCTVSNIDASGGPVDPDNFHPDVYQMHAGLSNGILYGITATQGINSQGFFAGNAIPVTDVAIVNCHVNNAMTSYARCFSFGGATRHLYVKNSRFDGGLNVWVVEPEQAFVATNVVLENVIFTGSTPGAVAGVTVR